MDHIEEFWDLDKYCRETDSQKQNYLKRKMNLQGDFLIGRVNFPVRAKTNSYLVRSIVSPENSFPVERIMFSGGVIADNTVFGSMAPNLKKKNIAEGSLVFFKFKPETNEKNIRRGKLLVVDESNITLLKDAAQFLKESGIDIETIRVDYHESGDEKLHKIHPVPSLYHDVLKKYLKREWDDIAEQKSSLEQEKEKFADSISEKEKELDDQEVELHQREEKIRQEFEKSEAVQAKLRYLGFAEDNGEHPIERSMKDGIASIGLPEKPDDIIRAIQQQLANREYDFDYGTIRQFYTALKTNQIIVLNGPSGTGKTSLVTHFADIISAKCKLIPVQPSWTDRQDLLGVFNPMKKKYHPSVLLDFMVQAKKDPDTLYIACLDEINLATIEYYLADILSVREQKKELELYSEFEYRESMNEIGWYSKWMSKEYGLENMEMKDWVKERFEVNDVRDFEYISRYLNLVQYPHAIEIPSNIRFVGTMNMDGSVKPLAPKVIDRSFIIRIGEQDEKPEKSEIIGAMTIGAEHFTLQKSNEHPQKYFFEEKFDQLSSSLEQIGAGYNRRVKKHMEDYIHISSDFDLEEETVLDEILMTKLLPRINYFIQRNDSFAEELKNKVANVVGKESKAYQKVDIMWQKSKNSQIFSYWS